MSGETREKTMADVTVQDLEQAREVLRLALLFVGPWLIVPLGLVIDELDRQIVAARARDKEAQGV
jgi:hypothetical protein